MPSPSAPLNPRKLLHSKWTAVKPRNKEKHFLVTGIVDPEPPGSPVVLIELEAVYSKRVRVLPWRELTDATQWTRGWGCVWSAIACCTSGRQTAVMRP